mmetsp:Transcript_23277/g.67367  ORF Transcript_23277/g.67367 Transcript_23277/m.67367 type:complete len:238 (-) Transcript_23277:663-1376(-)
MTVKSLSLVPSASVVAAATESVDNLRSSSMSVSEDSPTPEPEITSSGTRPMERKNPRSTVVSRRGMYCTSTRSAFFKADPIVTVPLEQSVSGRGRFTTPFCSPSRKNVIVVLVAMTAYWCHCPSLKFERKTLVFQTRSSSEPSCQMSVASGCTTITGSLVSCWPYMMRSRSNFQQIALPRSCCTFLMMVSKRTEDRTQATRVNCGPIFGCNASEPRLSTGGVCVTVLKYFLAKGSST